MIHNKSMKVYCVFSIILCLFYLELFLTFEYTVKFDALQLDVKLKILRLKILTIKIFVANENEYKFLYVRYGILKPIRLKLDENNQISGDDKSKNIKILSFIKVFLRHRKTMIEFVTKSETDVYANVRLTMLTYLSQFALLQTDVKVGLRFDNNDKINGESCFTFSLTYALRKVLLLINKRLEYLGKVRIKGGY